MEEIDKKILDMTIQVAGESEANRFSTREIAAKLGISEYMIFDHFHDKDNLLNLADERVADYYYASILKWGPQSANFFEFFSHIMDDLLSASSHGAFAINYCRVFPRYEKASDFSFFKEQCQNAIDTVLRFFPLHHPEDDAFSLWCYFTREFVCDTQLFIDHHLSDTPKNRYWMAKLIYEGFSSQLKAD
jgi:AcrR family transcriptional regulator